MFSVAGYSAWEDPPPSQKRHLWRVSLRIGNLGTSLVARWPMQGTWVRALVQVDPTCCGATKPMLYNY